MKKSMLRIFLTGILAMAAFSPVRSSVANQVSTWESIGPSGGLIGALAVHPAQAGLMYAVAGSPPYGVYKTTDAGQSWRHVHDLNSSYFFEAVIDPIDPHKVHVLLDRGVQSSTDGGNTWIYRPFPDDINGSGTILADRANPGVLYVAARRIMAPPPNFIGSALAILKSTDGGATWAVTTLTSPAAWSARTTCLVQDPADSRILVAGGSTSDATGTFAWLFRTTDGGATWTQIPTPPASYVFSLAVDSSISNRILAGTNQGVFISQDGGSTWANVLSSGIIWKVAFDAGGSSVLYAGTNGQFLKSVDGGANWQTGPTGVVESKCTGLAVAAPGRLFVSSQAGIRASLDAGSTWQDRMTGVRANPVNAVSVSPSSPNIVYFSGDSGELFKSVDFGETVASLPFPQPTAMIRKIAVNPAEANDLFVQGHGLLRSRDGGLTWAPLLPRCSDFLLARTGVSRIFALANESNDNGDHIVATFFKSVDGGLTWSTSPVMNNAQVSLWSTALAIDSVDENIVYIGINYSDWENQSIFGGLVFKSADGGASWTEIIRWPDKRVYRIAADPTVPGILYLAASDGVYKSANAGASWRKTGDFYSGEAGNFEFHPLDAREIWIGCRDDAFFSRDRGESWSRTYGWSLPPHLTQLDFAPDGGRLYAGTWPSGAYRLTRSAGDFTARISGTIRTAAGAPIAGVTLFSTAVSGTFVTDAEGRYSVTVPFGWTGTVTPAANGWTFTPPQRNYSAVLTDQGGQDYTGAPAPTIGLSREKLNFGVIRGGSISSPQSLVIGNLGAGTLTWAGSADAPWIIFTPQTGTGSRTIAVSVDPTGLPVGNFTGHINFLATGASNSPKSVEIFLKVSGSSSDHPPFGYLETPLDGTEAAGSVAVTGWALDDVEVTRVEIKRDPVAGEPGSVIGPDGLVYVGDAVFVPSARPDVEKAYSDYPRNDRAGWGYMVLTNVLPDGGNGTFSFTAIAHDSAGGQTRLGPTTIHIDNAHALAPFGAIDTPTQGGVATGAAFPNFGWALTPWPKEIPRDGSTLWVFVDGVPLGHPVYNYFRQDVFDLFPGYVNRDGAVGVFNFDTTKFTDGLHTIAWGVTDNTGAAEGIGSRYFTIQNGIAPAAPAVSHLEADLNPARRIEPVGMKDIVVEETGRIELSIPIPEGMTLIGWGETESRRLPIGSTLDPAAGKFSWMPGPGFLGRHVLHFAAADAQTYGPPIEVVVTIIPKEYRERFEKGRAGERGKPIKK